MRSSSSEHQLQKQKHLQTQTQTQPRTIPQHRRNKPDLSIDTFDANDYSRSPDYNDYCDSGLSTPLSPPPKLNHNASAQSPAIPFKSSQRSLRSANSPGTPSSAHYHRHKRDKGPQLGASRFPSASASASAFTSGSPLSESFNNNKVAAQSFFAAPLPPQEADAHARARARLPRLRTDRDSDSDADDFPAQTFLDTFPRIDMSNKENDVPEADGQHDPFARFDSHPHPRRDSRTRTPSPWQNHDRPRDSHDLSLSPRNVTRDSLLGNMLLSLDLFSMGQVSSAPATGETRTMSGFAEPSSYYENMGNMTSVTSKNPHTGSASRAHGYSYSSDYEAVDNSTRVRGRKHVARSRRSNSSSTAGNLGRLDSMRDKANQRTPHGTKEQRALHTRGGRGSKSSTSSADAHGFANILGTQRRAHGAGGPRRSSSLEPERRKDSFGLQPAEQRPRHQPQQAQEHLQPPWHLDLANSLFRPSSPLDDDLDDAAPTPTVPAGPRRQLQTMPSMPSFGRSAPMGEPLSPVRSVNLSALDRKRSNKSSRSAVTKQAQHSNRFYGHEREAAPPLPVPGSFPVTEPEMEESAPAPLVGYEKAKDKEPVHPAVSNSAVSQPKERQGFFRRMFGGASKNTSDQSSTAAISPTESSLNAPALIVNTMPSNTSTAASTTTVAPPPNASPSQPRKSLSNSPSQHASSSHGLQKKPSGFFSRRRKKSTSVANDPLPMPHILPPMIMAPADLPPIAKRLELLTPRPTPSPVTSLRKAMDPYLVTPQSATSSAIPSPQDSLTLSSYHSAVEEINNAGDGNPRSFSPDYEPDPRATIRPVRSEQKVRKDKSPAPETRRPQTPTKQAPQPHSTYERADSFLRDNSDSEGSPRWVKKHSAQPADNGRTSPANGTGRLTLPGLQTNLTPSSPPSNTTLKDKQINRLTQDSMSTNTTDRPGSLQLPIEGARTDSRSTTRSIPDLQVEDSDSKNSVPQPLHPLDEPNSFVIGEPTEDDRAKAQGIFDGVEEFIPREKAASWMGEEGPIRQRTLRAFMDLFNFCNKSVVQSLRDVCNRLVLRAETQQVDRILVMFSQRWVDCNINHGFKSLDVIHTMCYSIMLLNTDLHMADIESKMTRSQFIKNTMGTVRRAAIDSVPDAFDRPSILPGKGFDEERGSVDHERVSFRNSFIKLPGRSGSAQGDAPTELEDCGPLVKAPFEGSLKAWESQMENVLKDIYASIRDERLPLFGAEQAAEHSAGGLSVIGMLKRTPSVLSKAASENPSSRGRGPDSMLASNSRWASKSRSRPRGFGSAGFSSSRTSFDDGQSIWSPVESLATWSRASLGRTHTSMSMDSFASRFPRGDYQQSIGFANALSQAIIREDVLSSVPSLVSDELKTTQLLDDESLELAGPPWVKEGIIMHKHHLDGVDKKARDRNWSEVFCVIQKGNVSLFSFSPTKAVAKKGKNAPKKGGVVGGGNWQENATTLGTWNLRLCLASVLPSPGYSKQRPHVWALSLPTGAVHLFHVGTPEICNEFVMTANYWSARLSTHPLVGGVSNVEYGWSDAIINNALVSAINENSATNVAARQRSGSFAARSSLHSRNNSFRSVNSFDVSSTNPRTAGGFGSGNKLPGDIVTVAEWRAPTQSMRPSNAPEKEQLNILNNYVKSIDEDLQQHNAMRSPMLLAFTPRGSNAQKAMANWERRSSYLLREIVKFRTYVEVLQVAGTRKEEIYKERDVAQRAARGNLDGVDGFSFEGGEEEEDGGLVMEEEHERTASRGVDGDGGLTLRP